MYLVYFITVLLSALQMSGKQQAGGYSQNTNNIYSSGCSNERIYLECPNHHKIAIKRLFYGVKNDSHCLSRGRQHSVDCCQPTHNDCLVVDDTKYPFLNMLCSGRRHCDIEAKSISSGTSCHAKGYGPAIDYMSVIHDCIPDNNVYICSNSHVTGNLLHISNNNYPQPIAAGSQHCQCLIKTRNHVGINIYALDIVITHSENWSMCNQDLQLQDDDGYKKVITCGHPGLYAFRNIYNSAVRSMNLTLNNNATKPQGYIWIQVKAKEDQDIIDIYCGEEMRRYLSYALVGSDSHKRDHKNDGPHHPSIEQTNSGGNSNNNTKADGAFVVSDMMVLISGISIAMVMVIIIGLIGIVILCVRQSQDRQQKKCQKFPPFSFPRSNNKENKHTANSFCRYDDDDKYCAIKQSPVRMKTFTIMDISGEKALRETFSLGAASPELTNHNGYINCMEQWSANRTKSSIECRQNKDDDGKDDEVIMPKSEYIFIGRAIAPQAVTNELTIPTMHQKKKLKNKTVTFSPVAMVTPLPFGSEESVPEDMPLENPKFSYLAMYSKTMPAQSPGKVKKIISSTTTQDDMCLGYSGLVASSGLENVTEGDLWKAFKIKLDNDNVSSYPEECTKQSFVTKTMPEHQLLEPDYDDYSYDNIPYVNVGTLHQYHTPKSHQNDFYQEIVKKTLSREPTMESIPENR